jgi:hypothetical protein
MDRQFPVASFVQGWACVLLKRMRILLKERAFFLNERNILLKKARSLKERCILLKRRQHSFGFHKVQKIRKKNILVLFLTQKNVAFFFRIKKNARSFEKNPRSFEKMRVL